MEYSEQQLTIINSNEDCILVNAAAGSGKTATFVGRVVKLIEEDNVSPTDILAITFSRDAADNLRNRLSLALGELTASDIRITTFHAFALWAMKRAFPQVYAEPMRLVADWWKFKQATDIVGAQDYYHPNGMGLGIRAGELLSHISRMKSHGVLTSADLRQHPELSSIAMYGPAFDVYNEMATKAHYYDFDDILLHFKHALEVNDQFQERMSQLFPYIMVDEVQDTSMINLDILQLLQPKHLFAVGDFRQGIYGFINADINNILHFDKHFPDAKFIDLSTNYRSTRNIVDFSNRIIKAAKNPDYDKFAPAKSNSSQDGPRVKFTAYDSVENQSEGICTQIENDVSEGAKYGEYAIIVRTNSDVGLFQSLLTQESIPVKVNSKASFFDKRFVSCLLAYIRLSISKDDDDAFRQAINTPNRYISNAFQGDLDDYAYSNEMTLYDAAHEMTGKIPKGIKSYLDLIDKLQEVDSAAGVLDFVQRKTHLFDEINKSAKSPEQAVDQISSFNVLRRIASNHKSPESLIKHVEASTANNKVDERADGVYLTTAHGSKGLEYKHVFAPNFDESNYPHSMSDDPEEERRLFYVIASRAMKSLEISYCIQSDLAGKITMPSPFLIDINKEASRLGNSVMRGIASKSMYL